MNLWTFEPGVIASLAAAAGVYAWAVRRAVRCGQTVDSMQIAAFVAGWMVLVAALVSPLDRFSEWLFSAHMVQHELLMIVAAPLLVMGSGAFWQTRSASSIRRKTPDPVPWLLHAAALWIWHIPALFDAALESDAIHAAQHLSFFGTAVLFWWGLARGRYGRTAYGAGVLYVFTTAIHSGVLGALLTFSPRAWYAPYSATTARFGLTPLDDQQIGGLVMWIPASLVYIAVGLVYFAAWIRDSDRSVAMRARHAAVLAVVVAVVACGLAGCSRRAEEDAAALTGGDPHRGRDLVSHYGCDTCHTIPGVRSARGLVGPPLISVAARVYIGGHVPNTPVNMVSWIQHPHAHEPHTTMPEMGIPDADARDLAAFLYTLR
jgi:cytochrome c oxidase assembly factor CtaG/cytochrome c2